MKIIIDINHPAHVHFFKHLAWELSNGGHSVKITATSKDVTFALLDSYGFKYIDLGSYGKNYLSKLFFFFVINVKMLFVLLRERPDCVVSISSARPIFPKLLGIKLYVFTDTEHAKEQIKLFTPFAEKILTPSCFDGELGEKQVRYPGYHELAYLHPDKFKPDVSVLEEAGIRPGERFFILRFVAWRATHDIGHHGLSLEEKRKLVSILAEHGKVIITAESSVPEDLAPYLMKINPNKMHDLLALADMYIGEGGTMASEAAVLGTPSIFVSTLHMGYTDEEKRKYGLLFQTDKWDEISDIVSTLLRNPDLKNEWSKKRSELLAEKCDVSEWIKNFILEGTSPEPSSFSEPETGQPASSDTERKGKRSILLRISLTALFFLATALLVAFLVMKYPERFSLIWNLTSNDIVMLLLLSFFYYLIQGAILNELLKNFNVKLKFFEWSSIIMSTLFVNYFIPYSGLGLRAAYLKKVHRFDYTHFVSTLAATYLVEVLVFSLGGMLAMLSLGDPLRPDRIILNSIFLFVIILCVSISIFNFNLPHTRNRYLKRIVSLIHSWQSIRKSKKLILMLFLLTSLEFFLYALMFKLTLSALGAKVPFIQTFLPVCLSDYSFILRFTPGAIGVNESAVIYAISILGLDLNVAVSAVTVIRLATLLIIFIFGSYSFYLLLKKIRSGIHIGTSR